MEMFDSNSEERLYMFSDDEADADNDVEEDDDEEDLDDDLEEDGDEGDSE